MTCDGCHRGRVFWSIWDVHVNLSTMEVLCTRCFVARGGADKACVTDGELETLGVAVGASPHAGP